VTLRSTKTAWPQVETEIQILINKFKDEDRKVPRQASKDLREISPMAIQALIEAPKDSNKRVR
jgi:hypothetical protein